MEITDIHPANDTEREMAAHLLADSEPWTTLGITLEQCRKNCNDPEFEVYIASVSNKSSGIIIIDPRGVAGSPYIKSIAVCPEYRGEGIGSALLSFAEDLFRGRARYIFICVSSFNSKARKLYKKCGFRVAGKFRDYIIDGAAEILMMKHL
jgi:ribosomal-protein-alanine N-acetyltransferase